MDEEPPMNALPPHNAEAPNGQEPWATRLSRLKDLHSQAKARGLVREEDSRQLDAMIAYVERDEANRSIARATEHIILEFIDLVRESKEQQRTHLREALGLARWPGPKWRLRWEWYQMARSSQKRLTALWEKVSAHAAVRLAKAAREAGVTIARVEPQYAQF
jgi:hypothetical protein